MKHRFFPMFSTYNPIRDYVETEDGKEKYLGLSAPFPVSGEKQLATAILNARTSHLSLVFVGFFDPLAEFDSSHQLSKGGFYSVRNLLLVDDAESFRPTLLDLCRARGISLLYRYEDKKEGEQSV